MMSDDSNYRSLSSILRLPTFNCIFEFSVEKPWDYSEPFDDLAFARDEPRNKRLAGAYPR